MGGMPWKIVSPWSSDIAAVLRDTRERVFREGMYQRVPGRTFESLAALDAFFMADPEADDFEWTGEADAGTSSILDIRGVADECSPGSTAPLPPGELAEIFGTATPSADDVTDDRESAIYERLTRGDSHYVVIYARGKPTEVAFYGYSWD
jgi:hypothetical protein